MLIMLAQKGFNSEESNICFASMLAVPPQTPGLMDDVEEKVHQSDPVVAQSDADYAAPGLTTVDLIQRRFMPTRHRQGRRTSKRTFILM